MNKLLSLSKLLICIVLLGCADGIPGPGSFNDEAPYFTESAEIGTIRAFAGGAEITDPEIIDEILTRYVNRFGANFNPFYDENTSFNLNDSLCWFEEGRAFFRGSLEAGPYIYTTTRDLVRFVAEDTANYQLFDSETDNLALRLKGWQYQPFYAIRRAPSQSGSIGNYITVPERYLVPHNNELAYPRLITWWKHRGSIVSNSANNVWNEALGPQLTAGYDTVLVQQNYIRITQEL